MGASGLFGQVDRSRGTGMLFINGAKDTRFFGNFVKEVESIFDSKYRSNGKIAYNVMS